jgi:2-keto-4-pentenoate hydratase/2-oxohepta-3-ene-1,7-dioic acid hydratase in catechol pathway
MKLATLIVDGEARVAVVSAAEDVFWTVEDLTGRRFPAMSDLIAGYDAVKDRLAPASRGRPLSEAKLAAPLKPVRNVMCVGKNYFAHAQEFTRSGFDSSAKDASEAIPTAPIIFTKAPETVIGPGQDILYPTGVSEQVDYEAELGVVIGKGGKGISKAEALDHVFGYTIINDMTARDLQAKHKQWFIGKSLDTFCPMGPWLVTADDVEGADLDVKCWVNGELRQDANTRDLIFDVPTLIETLSAGLTLMPGDVIATGTPAGVGIGFTPPKFLAPGDEIAIEITGLGRLTNRLA